MLLVFSSCPWIHAKSDARESLRFNLRQIRLGSTSESPGLHAFTETPGEIPEQTPYSIRYGSTAEVFWNEEGLRLWRRDFSSRRLFRVNGRWGFPLAHQVPIRTTHHRLCNLLGQVAGHCSVWSRGVSAFDFDWTRTIAQTSERRKHCIQNLTLKVPFISAIDKLHTEYCGSYLDT